MSEAQLPADPFVPHRAAYAHFFPSGIERGKEHGLTQDALNEFTEANKLEAIDVDEFGDYIYGRLHDEQMETVVPAILEALTKIRYVGETYSPAENMERKKANDAIQRDIMAILTDNNIEYVLLDNVIKAVESVLGVVKGVEHIFTNKVMRVLQDIALEHLGTDAVRLGDIVADDKARDERKAGTKEPSEDVQEGAEAPADAPAAE